MPFYEAVKLALQEIRVQKLKSFFTLLGVMIGVMFLIAVVSIVTGMSKYVEENFAGRMLGANTLRVVVGLGVVLVVAFLVATRYFERTRIDQGRIGRHATLEDESWEAIQS